MLRLCTYKTVAQSCRSECHLPFQLQGRDCYEKQDLNGKKLPPIVGSLLEFQRRADDVCGQFADKVSDAERKVDIICDFLCLY